MLIQSKTILTNSLTIVPIHIIEEQMVHYTSVAQLEMAFQFDL